MAEPSPGLWAAVIGLGYLLGSIPFGLVLARLAGYGDIRKIGSGNIGATNVLRTGNKPLALATLILDSGKGGAAVWLAGTAADPYTLAVTAGVAAVFGHNFPVWLKFKGGKGVATTLGTLLVMAWPVGLAACATWLAIAAALRYSSVASLAALNLAPVYAWFILDQPTAIIMTVGAAILGVLATVRHHTNIRRLMKGEEPKIGRKS
ncbi:MAG: glycerol-3-phosphate 1-O-acyltransferase PlsY [Rhodospirillales bacterium]